MKILITGAAGFIGFHLAQRLIREGMQVVGVDNLNDYYSVELKYARLEQLGIEWEGSCLHDLHQKSRKYDNFSFIKCDLSNQESVESLFSKRRFDVVINLAAQAGVRYSLNNPRAYTSSNIEGFLNILEGCRHYEVKHLIFASSSSVYGMNDEMPFEVSHRTDSPVSLYAATKKANELMAYTYAHLYGIPSTGLRFFTVYGPFGRPDMAYFKFADLIKDGQAIDVYNNGNMARDFTYIDDITESICRLISRSPQLDSRGLRIARPVSGKEAEKEAVPYQLFNIGNGSPVRLMDFIEILEEQLGMEARKNMLPMQPGDVSKTWADVTDLYEHIGYRPQVDLREGLQNFVDWYKEYYGLPIHAKQEMETG